MKVESVMF